MIERLARSVVIAALLLAGTAQAQDPSAYRPHNPAAIVGVPPSSYQQSLFERSDGSESMSDMIVNGHVTGGKHFRAELPYSPPYTLNTELGSTYLDAFLRQSGSADMMPSSTGTDSPFYSPTASVTRTLPGQAAVLGPTMPRGPSHDVSLGAYANDLDLFSLPSTQAALSTDRSLARQLTGLGPQPFQTGPGQVALRQFLQQYRRDEIASSDLPALDLEDRDTQMPEKAVAPLETPSGDGLDPLSTEPSATLQALTPQQWADYFQTQAADESGVKDPGPTDPNSRPPDPLADALPVEEATPAAESSLALYATLQAFTQAKYDHYMAIGKARQQEGRYAEAIDAYTLADTYRPNDPAANAGKSLALFAKSQFSTSALFLARTLEHQPSYAQIVVDLAARVGGTEALHRRITEAETFRKRSDSFDLHFLLAYCYYQINDLGLAREAIEAALRKEPGHAGAMAMQRAIQRKLAG